MQSWSLHLMHHIITVRNITVSRVSWERKAIESITKPQVLKTMNDTNKKNISGRIQETCEMGFSKCKKSAHEAAQETVLQERTVLKLLVFGEGSSLVWFSKMHHSKTMLILNSPLSDKTAKRISVKKDWLKHVLQLLLTLKTYAVAVY